MLDESEKVEISTDVSTGVTTLKAGRYILRINTSSHKNLGFMINHLNGRDCSVGYVNQVLNISKLGLRWSLA